MIKRNKKLAMILAGIVAIGFFAVPALSISWDTVAMNALIRGFLNVQGFLVTEPVTSLTPVSTTGYTITATTSGVVFDIDPSNSTIKGETDKCAIGPAGSGVSVHLPTPTAATDGRLIGVRNITGTTRFVAYCGGLPIQTTSGATPTGIPDAVGDIQWFQLDYNSGISVWVVSEFIQ